MLPCCTQILDNDLPRAITEQDSTQLTSWDDAQASKAMRNLSYAYKDMSTRNSDTKMEDVES